MSGHLLGVLEPSIVFQVNRDAGCPLRVTSDQSEKTRRLGPLPNRSPGVVAVKRSSGHCRSKRINHPCPWRASQFHSPPPKPLSLPVLRILERTRSLTTSHEPFDLKNRPKLR
jgi:hypothetical protein